MAVNRVPVLKRCRSLGMDPIYLGINKKSNRQLKRANRKMSEYGLQLREKQKAKFIYGVLEKPFRNYYAKAKQQEGMTGENLMIILESRLDNVVFRLGLARTRKEAFEDTLAHERKVTALIHDLCVLADEEKDFGTANMLKWFVDEQIEEEANAQELIDSLKMIKDNGFGLYMLDKELKARVYTTPAPLATSAE